MQQDRQVALSVLTTRCFPDSPFPGKKLRDHFIIRFVGAIGEKHMLPLHHHGTERMCAGSGRRGKKKNDDTEVSSFSIAR
jgi:hypothetical protein